MSHASSSHDSETGLHGEKGHIVPFYIYRNVCITLLVLTAITVAASRFDFGTLNILIAMLIASVKALLVALFFMHLKYENPLTWLYAVFPLVLLVFLISGVFIDNPWRIDNNPYVPGEGSHAPK